MKFDISHSLHDPELNGSKGLYRGNLELNTIGCYTDYDAMQAFLREYKATPTTHRMYTKDCERLLLWAILYLNKPLSSMDRKDFDDYIKFMGDPDPEWCGKKVSKTSEEWKPFIGPLSNAALRTGVASINSFMNWLVNSGYMAGNPLGLIRSRDKSASDTQYRKVERFLDDDMWKAFMDLIDSFPVEDYKQLFQKERIRFMVTFFLMLGPRVSELSNTLMPDFHNNVGGWFWRVKGKGGKNATVAMPQDMVDALMRWRVFLGLPALPKPTEKISAIPAVNYHYEVKFDEPGLKPRRINEILKEFFDNASHLLIAGGQHDKAEKIKMASAHWLRHTSITQKMNAGIDRRLVQIEARHSDPRTTGLYTHDEEKLRSKESQKHKMNWKG